MDVIRLSDIDERLDSSDVAALCFLCKDVLNRKELENVKDGLDLFDRLLRKGLLENSHFLSQLLQTIHRRDLLSLLESDSRQPEQESSPQTDASPALTPYRKMLYHVSEEITENDLEKMKFLLTNKIARGRLDVCTTPLDVLDEMERQNYLSEDRLEDLEETLKKCDTRLVLKINQCRGASVSQEESSVHPIRNQELERCVSVNQRVNNPRPQGSPTDSCEHLCSDADTVSLSDQMEYYPMTHNPRGRCLIINNEHFRTNDFNDRPGTNMDKMAINRVFSRLGFEVQTHDDLTEGEMLEVVHNLGRQSHLQADALVVCVLSHGEMGCVFGVDGNKVLLSSLTSPFTSEQCRSLAGKPKLFFIQACQGKGYQKGTPLPVNTGDREGQDQGTFEADAGPVRSIPTGADFLIGMATVEECKSFRNTTSGSIYIQELCKQLERAGDSEQDILTVLTRVNNEVSKGVYLSYKQMPEPKYTLTKKLVLSFL